MVLAVVLVWHQAMVRFIYGRPHRALTVAQLNAATTSLPTLPLPDAAPKYVGPPVPTHAPVDPFRPLVSDAGTVLGQIPLSIGGWGTRSGSHHSKTSAGQGGGGAGSASCSSTYVVSAGDSLWSIAASTMQTSDSGTVSRGWKAIYDANQSVIGADPSYLTVGERLCLPQN